MKNQPKKDEQQTRGRCVFDQMLFAWQLLVFDVDSTCGLWRRHDGAAVRSSALPHFKIPSIAFNSSLLNSVFFKQPRLSFNCSTELAPIKTEVMRLSLSSQANDISASVCPRFLAS